MTVNKPALQAGRLRTEVPSSGNCQGRGHKLTGKRSSCQKQPPGAENSASNHSRCCLRTTYSVQVVISTQLLQSVEIELYECELWIGLGILDAGKSFVSVRLVFITLSANMSASQAESESFTNYQSTASPVEMHLAW